MPATGSFESVGFLSDNLDSQVQNFVDNFLRLSDASIFVPPVASKGTRHATRRPSCCNARPGIAQPNYPPAPELRLNRMYWPSGAARHAYMLALLDETRLGQLDASTSDGRVAGIVTLHDPLRAKSVAFSQMYALAATRISPADRGDNPLYIVPFVDQRYWWQFINAGSVAMELDYTSTWSDLINGIATRMGITISFATPVSYYGKPDMEFVRRFENVAILLDAIAHAIGCRVVVGRDGSVRLGTTTAELAIGNANEFPAKLLAGGINHNDLRTGPYAVEVIFPRYKWGHTLTNDDSLGIIVNASDVGFTVASISTVTYRTIFTRANANFSVSSDPTTPDNDTEVSDLARQIARDYYGWLSLDYDLVYPGLTAWNPIGFDDACIWDIGHIGSDFFNPKEMEYQPTTRVQSLPITFGVDEMLHQFSDTPEWPSPSIFKMHDNSEDDPDDFPGLPNAVHRDPALNGRPLDTDFATDAVARAIIVDSMGGLFDPILVEDKLVQCYWDDQAQQWVIQQSGC